MKCGTCGHEPCATPVFCELTADKSRNHTHNKPKANGGANGADERAIAELAKLGTLAYQKRRVQEAKAFGIPVAALDKLVRQSQAKVEEDKAELPHWKVEPWNNAVDGAELLTDIARVFTRYVFLPQGASTALALWVMHAWTMDAGDISPFMVLVSPTKRCGKTTVLIILTYLTPRSELASNISPSALFRYVEEARPTLLIDEGDSFLGDNEELRGILNSGHTKAAAHVIRNIEINGEHKPRRFSTWAPKAIAAIRELADTLEDRAVVLMLQRKPKGANVERLRKRDSDEFATLRRKAARWTADNFDKLSDPDPAIPEALNDRAADNWRPLLAIADIARGEWPIRARDAACILSGEGHDAASINVELLADIKKAFGDTDAIASADLVAALVSDPERPWAEWGKNGKPITQNGLARLLRHFRITSQTVHLAGRADAKGYRRVWFEEHWAAYFPGQTLSPQPPPPFEASNRPNADGSKGSSDFQSVLEESLDASENGNLSYSHAGLDAWTDEKGVEGGERRFGHALSDQQAVIEELAARGNGKEPSEICAQCGAADPGPLLHVQTREAVVRLHRECLKFWCRENPQPRGTILACAQIAEVLEAVQ
jgi:putative DNA primase/helicase